MPVRRSVLLLFAFSALLAICGAAAWAVWRNTRAAQSNATALYERELVIHEALGELRSNVYLNAILARDILLEREPDGPDYPTQYLTIDGRIHASIEVLQQMMSGQEAKTSLAKLSGELEGYNETIHEIVNWTPEERVRLREEMLRRRSGRRRDILALTERIETLAKQSSDQERQMLATSDDSFRASLGWIALAALLASGGVTILTLVRMRGLEIRSDAAQSELRSLSGQLRTAQEQERKYLSRELHDQVGQMLTGLRLELTAVARNQSNLDPQMRMLLDRAKATVEQTLGIVRNIAMLLRPSMLDDLGLTPALAWLVKENSRTSGIDIHKEIDARVDQLPDAHRTCLYRVVQEALTNAARHSGGRHVDLRVTVEHGWVRVRVQDDGRGFVLAQRRRGLGLVGMEERVRELGGYTSVTSVPGRGTCVEIRLPQPATMEDANGESSDRGRSRDRADGVKAAL